MERIIPRTSYSCRKFLCPVVSDGPRVPARKAGCSPAQESVAGNRLGQRRQCRDRRAVLLISVVLYIMYVLDQARHTNRARLSPPPKCSTRPAVIPQRPSHPIAAAIPLGAHQSAPISPLCLLQTFGATALDISSPLTGLPPSLPSASSSVALLRSRSSRNRPRGPPTSAFYRPRSRTPIHGTLSSTLGRKIPAAQGLKQQTVASPSRGGRAIPRHTLESESLHRGGEGTRSLDHILSEDVHCALYQTRRFCSIAANLSRCRRRSR